MKYQKILYDKSISATVISIPCVENFSDMGIAKINKILGSGKKIYIEAGVSWMEIVALMILLILLVSKPLERSGPKDDVYNKFDISVKSLVNKTIKALK